MQHRAAWATRMPAEWEPHAATWIAWPHNPDDWPGKFQPIPVGLCGDCAPSLARGRRAHSCQRRRCRKTRAQKILARNGVSLATRALSPAGRPNRVWMRDSGPIFVRKSWPSRQRPPLAITNWKFNAWAKYDDWQHDDKLPSRVAKLLHLPEWTPEIPLANGRTRRVVLEGGSIDVNGAGALLTTEECLLSAVQQRNPGVSREQLERMLPRLSRHRPGALAESWHRRRRHARPRRRHHSFCRRTTIVTSLSRIPTTKTTCRWRRILTVCAARASCTASPIALSSYPCPRR